MKAYTTENGQIVVFRPDLNAERMVNSAKDWEMPPFPQDRFVDAVKQVVRQMKGMFRHTDQVQHFTFVHICLEVTLLSV